MKCSETNSERLKHRVFTPHDIDLCSWEQIQPIFDELQNREISSGILLEQFILDCSDLASALQEESARIQLAAAVNTADEEAKKRFQHFNEVIYSQITELFKVLDLRILDSLYLPEINMERYGHLIRLMKMEQSLFRNENIPLAVEDAQLSDTYSSITGGMAVEFDGRKHNLTELSNKLNEPDRPLREKAWFAIAECRLAHKEAINDIFHRMIELRHQSAINAGFGNFRDYRHLVYRRFDYSPEDCFRFHETVEKYAVPALRRRNEKRRIKMGLETLRPWDMSVDIDGKPPLKPFEDEDGLISGVAQILDRIYPRLGDNLRLLKDFGNLDLFTRQNKATVGFNMPLDETRVSFIFMNATNTHQDVTVLLHESGHAVETRACIAEPILHYRHTPQEWGECASQSMELLGLDHLDIFYSDPNDISRCKIEKFEDVLSSLVHTARIDAFQHWVYTNPHHSAEERESMWLHFADRFGEGIDFTGLQHYRQIAWQGIPHLFIVPFYYIEYGIAQLAALQVYRKAKTEGEPALKRWLDTMRLGFSRSVADLYKHAGLRFEFYGEYAAELISMIEEEIDRLENSL